MSRRPGKKHANGVGCRGADLLRREHWVEQTVARWPESVVADLVGDRNRQVKDGVEVSSVKTEVLADRDLLCVSLRMLEEMWHVPSTPTLYAPRALPKVGRLAIAHQAVGPKPIHVLHRAAGLLKHDVA